MATEPDTPEPSPLDIGRIAAKQLAGSDWQVEVETPLSETSDLVQPSVEESFASQPEQAPAVRSPSSTRIAPPAPEQLVEAMLFVGGQPLTADRFCAILRVPADVFHAAVDALTRKYKAQNRPYSIQPRDDGYALVIRPLFRALRDKLYGGPREARLTQPALDVLSLVAYRQPITKADIDALRGHDSGAVLRQLVRLGLVAVTRRGESDRRDVCYGTTPRFLELFNLASLDDLPRLGDAEPL
jgi:segregation and condensation protein B